MREKHSLPTSRVENKEWTIEISRDSQPGEQPFVAVLVFSLNAQNEVVTGEVWHGVERRFLSKVKGTHRPLPRSEQLFMSLDFNWGKVNVALSGITDETPETVLFTGRYRASALTGVASNGAEQSLALQAPAGPGDGDTGSGTGQQT
ncbi:MAG TPA: hypothetical protein VGO56_10765 [Pyrinomonadaceae bacterium]|nr:hypothetical protein [Pyrinomonadaceae bacterium]